MSLRFAQRQNRFHGDIVRFVEAGGDGLAGRTRRRRLPAATDLVETYRELRTQAGATVSDPRKITVDPYAGEDVNVLRMMEYLGSGYRDCLLGAYIHGSLGVYEQGPYCDFDALVILRSEVIESPDLLRAVARWLYRGLPIMYAADPLQHHGWFVLTEADLSAYCDAYFPLALFEEAKVMTPGLGNTLEIRQRDSRMEQLDAYFSVSAGLVRKLGAGGFGSNAFLAKALLSQLMLLPSLFIQAKYGQGIFKKDSFSRIRDEVRTEHLWVLDEATRIRSTWKFHLGGMGRKLLESPGPGRQLVLRLAPPRLPGTLIARLDTRFVAAVKSLVEEWDAVLVPIKKEIEVRGQ